MRAGIETASAAVILFENMDRSLGGRAADLVSRIAGLPPAFVGEPPHPLRGVLAIFDRLGWGARVRPPPSAFRVLAILPTFNEEDVVEGTIIDLLMQGAEVYVIDNWSTDTTVARVRKWLGAGVVGLERFPPKGPAATYNLFDLLRRVEQVAHQQSWATWVMLHDADERRRSPWPGVGLREALWRVDQAGFSCIDHVTLNFCPVDNGYDAALCDLEKYFKHFEFSKHPGHFHQRRAWKRSAGPVALAESAGHDVQFPSRQVFPYKFLLKHYPIRSQAHGERKVLRERAARWNNEERSRGWHRQYDSESRDFLRPPGELLQFDDQTFWSRYLVERLSGAGIFANPPDWATPPRW